jgi:hypothetical protein
MQLKLTKCDGSHKVITLTPGFFQPEVNEKGKIIKTPVQKAYDIMHDERAETFVLIQNRKIVYENKKKMQRENSPFKNKMGRPHYGRKV